MEWKRLSISVEYPNKIPLIHRPHTIVLIIHFRSSRKGYLETNINFKNSQSTISQPEDKQLTVNIDLLENEVTFKMIIEYYYKFYTFYQHSHLLVFYSVY